MTANTLKFTSIHDLRLSDQALKTLAQILSVAPPPSHTTPCIYFVVAGALLCVKTVFEHLDDPNQEAQKHLSSIALLESELAPIKGLENFKLLSGTKSRAPAWFALATAAHARTHELAIVLTGCLLLRALARQAQVSRAESKTILHSWSADRLSRS